MESEKPGAAPLTRRSQAVQNTSELIDRSLDRMRSCHGETTQQGGT